MALTFAHRLGLIAFAATALEAAASGADLSGGITASLVRLGLFFGLGLVCGTVAGWLMEEQAQTDFKRWKEAADAPAAAMLTDR